MNDHSDVDKSDPVGNLGRSSGALDFIYSPFDTPETASDGVICSPHAR